MKRILVAIDFTDLTGQIIAKAMELASAFDAKVWLIHIAAPDPDFVGYEVGPQYIRDSRAKNLREEHRILQKSADELKEKGIESEALLIQGPTVESLLEKVKDLNIDLLIMGAHNHGVLFEKLIGSTWSDVVRKARVPLLIVPEFSE